MEDPINVQKIDAIWTFPIVTSAYDGNIYYYTA